jgi:hypothetical protein
MKLHCTIREENGQWVVRHDGPEVGAMQVRALSREAALEKMRGELRYRLELCPCTGETYQHLEIELEET